MATHNVSIFKPYPFSKGQKIRIDSGPRKGDWEIVSFTERKVKLRCPISFKEFEWNRFCYLVEEHRERLWPEKD